MRSNLNKLWAKMLPINPVITTALTVTAGIPPISSESQIAMAVVMDVGIKVYVKVGSKEVI